MEARSNSSLSPSDEFTERFLLSMMTSAPCCVFLIINGTILFLLRSKPVFSRCPRYVLLFNLVLADTVLIAQGQTLYLLATFKVRMPFPLCVYLAMVSRLNDQISPLILVFMSLERCIAVCFPFRHCTMVTLRNTFFVIFLTWTVSTVNILVQVLLLLEYLFHELPNLQMGVVCKIMSMPVGPKFQAYEEVYTYTLFSLSALVISCSLLAVTVVACFASGNRAQMEKTLYTLLLHFFQLSLNLLSVMSIDVLVAVSQFSREKRLLDVMYVLVVLMPCCLSALTYGLRDPALRPALGTHLCSAWQLWAGRVQGPVLRNKLKSRPNAHTGPKLVQW